MMKSLPAASALLAVLGFGFLAGCSATDTEPDTPEICRPWAEMIKATAGNKDLSDKAKTERFVDVFEGAPVKECFYERSDAKNRVGRIAVREGLLMKGLVAFGEAENILDDAQSTDRQSGILKAIIASNRGAVYLRLGRPDDAQDFLKKSRALFARHEGTPAQWANLAIQEGRLFRLGGRNEDAKRTFQEGLEYRPKGPARAALLMELARLYLDSGRLLEAEKMIDQAEEALLLLDKPRSLANVLVDRAEVKLHKKQWAETIHWVKAGLKTLAEAEQEDLNLETQGHLLMAVAWAELGHSAKALEASRMGLELLENLRQKWGGTGSEFFAWRQMSYRLRFDLAVAAGASSDLWSVFEKFRSQGLLQSLGQPAGQGVEPGPRLDEWKQELDEAIRMLSLWNPDQETIIRDLREKRVRELLRRQTEFKNERGPEEKLPAPPEIDLQTAQGFLGSETLALVFVQGRKKIHLLMFDATSEPTIRTLGEPARIEPLVASIIESLESSTRANARLHQTSDDLGHLLLGPAIETIQKAKRLVIVADGALERLPFEVLQHPTNGRLLIESHEIVYLPSFSVLARLRARVSVCEQPEKRLLAMADPIFGSKDLRWPESKEDARSQAEAFLLKPLPGSRKEAEGIAALDPQGTTLFLDRGATRRNLLAEMPGHRLIHIATHARSETRIPELSKIALSCIDSDGHVPDQGDVAPGPCDLYFSDVVQLELCGQIVVLSACESAQGRALAGEGILGLPWAFLHAGASSVVASLWEVEDEATIELMTGFHQNLARGANPATALSQAKREQIAAGIEPRHWAPFVLLGDWQTKP